MQTKNWYEQKRLAGVTHEVDEGDKAADADGGTVDADNGDHAAMLVDNDEDATQMHDDVSSGDAAMQMNDDEIITGDAMQVDGDEIIDGADDDGRCADS